MVWRNGLELLKKLGIQQKMLKSFIKIKLMLYLFIIMCHYKGTYLKCTLLIKKWNLAFLHVDLAGGVLSDFYSKYFPTYYMIPMNLNVIGQHASYS